jgi:hypothetical protein
LWPVTPASHFPQPESDSAQKTLATSGHTSPDQYELFDLDYASLRMSKDTSASDSEKSLESWNKLVIQRRGEYSARLKSAHRTSASGSSSWPTIRASEYKDTGPIGSKSHDHMLGKGYLCAVVTQDAANWPTPDASNHRDGEVLRKDNNLEQGGFHGVSLHHAMTKYGQAAPANHNTHGSRQGLSEQSQRNWQTFAHGTHNRGETPHRQVVKALVNGDKAKTQCLTVDQVFAEEIKGTSRQESSVDWRTPQANEAGARVETLYTKDGQPARPGERAYRKTPDGRMVLQSQTINQQVEMVQNWATPQAHDAQGPKTPEQIAAMRSKGHGVKNLNEQACWGTPTARDHKSGRGNEEREYKELTPMVERTQTGKLNPRWVETLMGLPVGWVMPSCKSPVTIEPTSFDSSATESCLPPQSELFAF